MPMRIMGSQIVLAATLLAAGASLSGCTDGAHPQSGWNNQWYRKGQTPEEIAEYRKKHPERGRREGSAPSDDGAITGAGGMGGAGGGM